MWDQLPHALQMIVFDFHGCTTFKMHRNRRFVCGEILAFQILSDYWRRSSLLPSLVRRLDGFKECLQLAYFHSQREALVEKSQGISASRLEASETPFNTDCRAWNHLNEFCIAIARVTGKSRI